MKYFLYVIVAVSGASILALEILGTRILGPFYGVSIFLWSALISVTLAALSCGYAVGGIVADKRNRPEDLSLILIFSGVWTILIPFLKHPILSITEPLGLRAAVLFSALILFFPPLFLLGMVSPLAIKLKTKTMKEIGRIAGNLYAISTLASVMAALLTGFFLIPYFGIAQMIVMVGSVLIFCGALFLTRARKYFGIISIIILIAILIPINYVAYKTEKGLGKDFLFKKESPYGKIEVYEKDGLRYLLIDRGIHTIEDIETFESMMNYAVVLDIVKLAFQKPGEMLLIGLGGGSVAKNYYLENWKVDAIEIDPVVVQAAKKFFKLDRDIANIYIQDGRRFLKQTDKKYDLIILDAFGSSSLPFHLITLESFREISNHLKENGIMAINIESIGWESELVLSIGRTLKSVFDEVIVLPLDEPPNVLGNLIILASDRRIEIDEEFLGNPADYVDVDPVEHWRVVEKNHAWDNRFYPDSTKGILLTDNRNPVDVWSESINIAYRRELQKYFSLK